MTISIVFLTTIYFIFHLSLVVKLRYVSFTIKLLLDQIGLAEKRTAYDFRTWQNYRITKYHMHDKLFGQFN